METSSRFGPRHCGQSCRPAGAGARMVKPASASASGDSVMFILFRLAASRRRAPIACSPTAPRSTNLLGIFHVVAEDQFLVADVESAVGDHGVRPVVVMLLALFGKLEAARFLPFLGIRFQ